MTQVAHNKYDGFCAACRHLVPARTGYTVQAGGAATIYCGDHYHDSSKPLRVNRKLTIDGVLITPYEREKLNLIRVMPGAKWNPQEKHWTVSMDIGDRARVLELADQIGLSVPPELRRVEESDQARAAHKAGLYNFQVAGVDWLSKRTKALLGDEMGLGKTVEALCALPEVAMAIVICPAILKPNWAKECERWRPDLTPTIVEGRAGFRLPDVGEVLICNYDILPSWLEPVKKKDAAEDWDTEVSATPEVVAHAKQCIVIVDEGHKVKNHRTARAKRVRGLVKITSRVWVLTGTPLENRPFDLWGVLSATGMARDVFGSFPKFVARMGGRPGQYGGYEFDGPVDPIVPDLLKRVMLRRLRAEVLPDLPKITYSTVVCPLPVGLRSDMDALWAKYGPLIDRDRELPPFEEFSALRAQLAESRIEPAIELAEACEEALCPLVVFSAHVAPVVTLGKRPGWACIHGAVGTDDRQRIVDAFQAGRLQGVALTIGTGGSGLTLHRAWKAIFLDLDWVPSQNEQAAARLCRIGQESDKVEVVRMVSDHVMDRHVLSLISWKMGVIESALNDNGRLAAVQ